MRRAGRITIRLLLGGILLYASLGKITHAGEFATAVANYRLLPSSLVLLGSLVIPWLEFILGVFLVADRWMRTSAFMAAILFMVFTTAVTQAMVRGIDISCGCFELTGSGRKISSLTLLRNLLLFSGAVFLMQGPAAREVSPRH